MAEAAQRPVRAGKTDVDGADRVAALVAVGTRDTGDGDAVVRAGDGADALGHRAGDRLADRAVLVEQSLRHAEHVRFDKVRIAHDAAHEDL